MNDLMLDLETTDIIPSSGILSIGGVYFDRSTGDTGDEFYEVYNMKEGLNTKRTSSEETIKWWENQDKKVYEEAWKGVELLDAGLLRLSSFYNSKTKVWVNGATFDISILEDAYRQSDIAIPWKFWDVRDVRTVVDLANDFVSKGKAPDDAHNPIADCKYQIQYIHEMIQILRS